MRRDGRFQKGESNMVNRKCRMLFKSLCISMPVSVRLNHAIADGFLVANVYRLLEKEMAAFCDEMPGT